MCAHTVGVPLVVALAVLGHLAAMRLVAGLALLASAALFWSANRGMVRALQDTFLLNDDFERRMQRPIRTLKRTARGAVAGAALWALAALALFALVYWSGARSWKDLAQPGHFQTPLALEAIARWGCCWRWAPCTCTCTAPCSPCPCGSACGCGASGVLGGARCRRRPRCADEQRREAGAAQRRRSCRHSQPAAGRRRRGRRRCRRAGRGARAPPLLHTTVEHEPVSALTDGYEPPSVGAVEEAGVSEGRERSSEVEAVVAV